MNDVRTPPAAPGVGLLPGVPPPATAGGQAVQSQTYNISADEDVLCQYVRTEHAPVGSCRNMVLSGSYFCTMHTCASPGCNRMKSSRVEFCPAHSVEPLSPMMAELSKYRWYKPRFTKQMAEQYLFQSEPGDFVIRPSTRHTGSYSMNVHQRRPHMHITNMLIIAQSVPGGPDRFKLGPSATRTFDSIPELVNHFASASYETDPASGQGFFLKRHAVLL